MIVRTRNKTYGKRRGNNDLVAAFSSLRLSTSKEETLVAKEPTHPRPPLHERSHNVDIPKPPLKAPATGSIVKHSEQADELPSQQEDTKVLVENASSNVKIKPSGKKHPKRKVQPKAETEAEAPLKAVTAAPKALDPTESHAPAEPTDSGPPLPADLKPLLALPTTHPTTQSLPSLFATLSTHFTITKISQGSYASIYRLSLLSSPDSYTIWKLIPLRPRSGKGSRLDGCTSYPDLVSEVKLLHALGSMPGFVELRSSYLLHGVMPNRLRDIDEEWWETLHCREQENMGQKYGERVWGDEQWWCWVEMSDAGQDLEGWWKERDGKVQIMEAWDVWWGIVEALAHGEQMVGFEHRDLHPGNVCVQRGKGRKGEEGMVKRWTKLEVTLIDYTLSRAEVPVAGSGGEEDEEGKVQMEVLANSMRDANLFTQDSHNAVDQAQFDTYRDMRDIMHAAHSMKERKDGWKSYMPATNVLWLHHLLVILMNATGMFDGEWRWIARVIGTEEARCAFRLDEIRQALQPDKWRIWDFASAGEMLAWQVGVQEENELKRSESAAPQGVDGGFVAFVT